MSDNIHPVSIFLALVNIENFVRMTGMRGREFIEIPSGTPRVVKKAVGEELSDEELEERAVTMQNFSYVSPLGDSFSIRLGDGWKNNELYYCERGTRDVPKY